MSKMKEGTGPWMKREKDKKTVRKRFKVHEDESEEEVGDDQWTKVVKLEG